MEKMSERTLCMLRPLDVNKYINKVKTPSKGPREGKRKD
jgi:hypothetical protein